MASGHAEVRRDGQQPITLSRPSMTSGFDIGD